MKIKQTPIASAVALALLTTAFQVHSQQAEKPADGKAAGTASSMDTVVVTGIRASLQKSLDSKRDADSVTEVVTAEDIGKMPDKNVADALQRLPGVNISSAASGEGGFDENDRVSLRGTSPSLTQTTINGHMVGTGDWFILDQFQTVGRSVSYSLLPSELVGQVIVRKSSQADVLEGGVAGSVDIITRKPLDFKQQLTAEASVGAVRSDLAQKTDPQFSGLINWKNDAKTAGVLLQAFSETRHVRRDGQEFLGYQSIGATSPLAVAHPDLAGVLYPSLIGSALFEQKRERKGGLIDVEVKPNNDLTLDLSGFKSHMDASNYNRNFMAWPSNVVGSGVVPASYTVRNGTLVAATWNATAQNSPAMGVVDDIYRPGSASETSFINLDAKFKASDNLTLTAQIGHTEGLGKTDKEVAYEANIPNTGLSYVMNGLGSPANVSFPGGNTAVFIPGVTATPGWTWGSQLKATDKESYGQVDAEWGVYGGLLQTVKFGARVANHERDVHFTYDAGPNWAIANVLDPSNMPAWNGATYPGNFGSGLGGSILGNLWQLPPGAIEAWADANQNRDPVVRDYWQGNFNVKEDDVAGYAMGSLAGNGWRGNLGLRFVTTKEKVLYNASATADTPGAITTSAFGPYLPTLVEHKYNDVLPSANIKFDLSKELVARVAASRTMARPDFSALGGSINQNDLNLSANGGNPNLKPIRSNNAEASVEWYFAPHSLLSAGVFYMDLTSYVTFGTTTITLYNQNRNQFLDYNLTAPVNSSGTAKGFELAYEQPIAGGFGVALNYTYANGKDDSSHGDLVGASKQTYNATGYYEDERFSARLAYTYRSHFLVGLDRSTNEYQDDTANLAASLSYKVMDNVSLTFDALNLNNPVLKYYANNKDQPRAFYINGRQYYFGVRMKF